jgi:antibiotic biosynthesis monooxygenase (ABM) superfamily enzyme
MNVVFDNPMAYVVDYPGIDAVELIDKRRGRGTLMRADIARRFREELEHWAHSPDPDELEILLEHYRDLLTQPAVYH